jgi:drug/metabolite transporter (DMT)-like permease
MSTDLPLLIAINFMWALKWTLSKVALRQLDPVSITLFPMIGAILLLLPHLYQNLKDQPTYLGVIRKEAARPSNLFRFFVLGVAGQVASQVLVSWGLEYESATVAALIGLSMPILTAILALIIVGERLTRRLLLSFSVALAGVLLITKSDFHVGLAPNRLYLIGVLMFFAATLGAAFYNAYSKRILDRFLPTEILLYSYIFVVLSLCPLYLVLEKPFSMREIAEVHWQTWCSLICLSIFVYWLSMVLFMRMLTRRCLAPISISIYLTTIFGVLISAFTLHESLTSNMVIGALLVFFGTIFANVRKTSTQS